MLISIGILARNEERRIEATLHSLFEQSVFRHERPDFPESNWEILVVPNGSSDRTSDVASATLSTWLGSRFDDRVAFGVHEIQEGGKSNAWNVYVHTLSSRDADLIILMDADIEFAQPETIANTLIALQATPGAVVAVDLPLKDAVKKPKKTIMEMLSTRASATKASEAPAIAGSFYCARANALRDVWMPKGLSGEDGYLRSMIITDCFRSPEDPRRVVRAPNSSHYYETLTGLREIFRHELRMVMGTAMNCYVTWDLLGLATDPTGPGAGVVVRHLLEADPHWYVKVIRNAVKNRGLWVLPRGMLFRRFSSSRGRVWHSVLRRWPVQFWLFLLDLPVLLVANEKLKSEKVVGYW